MKQFPLSDAEAIFPGNSEMARLMRAHDWDRTPLGNPEGWPDGLKIPLRMLLTSRFEMWLGWGPDLCFFYNDAYIPTLGIKHPSMLGKPFREVWSEVYADVADQVELVRAGEATWNKALLLLLERSGYPEETYHSFSYSPLHAADGSVDGLLCVVSEETERVISERRLETLRSLGTALAGCADEDAVCAAACKVFGANRRDFPFALLYLTRDGNVTGYGCTDDAKPLLDRHWPVLTAGDAEFDLPAGQVWPTGEWNRPPAKALAVSIPGHLEQARMGTLILGLNPYRPDDPNVLDFARLIAGQISGALANVQALDAARRRADRIWTHSRDLMVVVSADGIFRSVSPAWTRILGHELQDVVGHHFGVFLAPEDLEPSTRAMSAALRESDLTGFENRFLTADGEPRWFAWHTAMEDGLVYAYGRDITEQKANAEALLVAREALLHAQKMEAVGQLTGGIAHDFNNLLTPIMGSLDLLQRRIDGDREIRLIEGAMQSAERARTLVQRLLAFARRQPLQARSVDLAELVNGMSELVTSTLGPRIPVVSAIPDGLPPVHIDPNQLEMAILNLAVNARDAMPDGGKLTLAASEESVTLHDGDDLAPGRYIRLRVTDTGTGMDKETVVRAVEPFFSTKGVGHGTGLGLSMVHGLAAQLGGAMRISSELGRGTNVDLWLPLSADQVVVPQEVAEVLPNSHFGSVLLVDDEPLIRMNTADMLSDLGYCVTEAASAEAALEIIANGFAPDILITDHLMPGITGTDLSFQVRNLLPATIVLIISGYADVEAIPPDLPRLTKPFRESDLSLMLKGLTSPSI